MKTTLSVCITIIGMCLLMASSSFADGGGVKSVQDPVVDKYCNELITKGITPNYNGPKIDGKFIAHQDPNGFTAHVFLEGNQYGVQSISAIGKIYTIYVPNGTDYKPICDYTNAELMDRYIGYACKREVDTHFGYPVKTVFPKIITIYKTNQANCNAALNDPDNKPMISGNVTIRISPIK